MKSIDWKQVGIDTGKGYVKGILSSLFMPIGGLAVIGIKYGIVARDIIKGKYSKKLDFKIFEADDIKGHFKFPPQHPIINAAYAMSDILPNQYVPLASFHEYMRHAKHADFIELAACLGAKEIHLEYAEIDNKALDLKADSTVPIKLSALNIGINGCAKSSHNVSSLLAFAFPQKNSQLKPYSSPWMNTEPTWVSMDKLRRNHFLESYSAEFSYSDEMGITPTLSAGLNKIGVNIGGKFSKMHSIKLNYRVVFWPME